ncbi:LPS export ABC transporter periplasmic protein LptC [Microvirga pakistanensis]|uniref:LPS export ABC transporter periplasmic protein LptC n=1 Tax=Microvirga pakistanensis TaxID=1682650 RepID=UPI00106B0192|nr:LPS export ABC transporter periplasmic protein LptC [Microvirga pakistanensis]
MAGFQGTTMQGSPASRPAARTRAFNKARRHSRWVRFAKFAIPVGSVLAMGVVGFFAYFEPFKQIENLSFDNIGVSGTNVTMEAPRLTGFKNDNRPYEVTASAATQDVRKPNFVELKDLRARIVTDDKGSVARLEANMGVLDTQKEQMNLNQGVRVTTNAGQEVQMISAFVDFKSGGVTSNEPVTVILGGNGRIEAEGLKVVDNGKVLSFKGRVRTTFMPSTAPEPDAPAPPATDSKAPVSPPAAERPAAQPTSVRP